MVDMTYGTNPVTTTSLTTMTHSLVGWDVNVHVTLIMLR